MLNWFGFVFCRQWSLASFGCFKLFHVVSVFAVFVLLARKAVLLCCMFFVVLTLLSDRMVLF